MIEALRPLVDLDNGEFDQRVYDASRIKPGQELLAFAIGLLLGIASVLATVSDQGATWLTIYLAAFHQPDVWHIGLDDLHCRFQHAH